jgi:hypothetical protein
MKGYGLDLSGSRQWQMMGSCERTEEIKMSKKAFFLMVEKLLLISQKDFPSWWLQLNPTKCCAACDDSLHIRAHPRRYTCRINPAAVHSQQDQDALHYLRILTTYTSNDCDRYVTTRNAEWERDPRAKQMDLLALRFISNDPLKLVSYLPYSLNVQNYVIRWFSMVSTC